MVVGLKTKHSQRNVNMKLVLLLSCVLNHILEYFRFMMWTILVVFTLNAYVSFSTTQYYCPFLQLKFEGVEVKSVEIKTSGSEQKNALFTMWQQNELDISPGMNFALTGGSTVVLFSHLQHQSFSYNIEVSWDSTMLRVA